ncbi:MAG: glycine dehydrogenase, partial [Actinomycetota bacterium]|nr:glycine dehydrogenase [Actinomycetota bacterium]
GEFFHELVIETPEPVSTINARLAEHQIIGGYDLGHLDPALDRHMLICATEMNDRESIDRLVDALAG